MSDIICDMALQPSGDEDEIQVYNQESDAGNGDAERFDESNLIEDYIKQNAEEINANGIKVLYLAIQTSLEKDKITGEDPEPIAIELYTNNIRMKTDSDTLPSATNKDTSYGMIGWIDTMVYHMSKYDFGNKTYKINLDNDTLYKQDWIPKPGDVIIVNLPPYYPTLEVLDVDDDFFHFLNSRPNWVLTLQSYTKKIIDFSYIKSKYPNEWNIIKDMVDPINENINTDDGIKHSNNLITANTNLETDERDMNSPNKKRDEGLFKEIFGD